METEGIELSTRPLQEVIATLAHAPPKIRYKNKRLQSELIPDWSRNQHIYLPVLVWNSIWNFHTMIHNRVGNMRGNTVGLRPNLLLGGWRGSTEPMVTFVTLPIFACGIFSNHGV